MRWLVTAGGTQVPIDRVRAIGNAFTGRTGAAIAAEARRRGHHVTLLTSHPHTVDTSFPKGDVRPYVTFDDLQRLMADSVREFDCVVHSAAVSDYRPAGVFASAPGTAFDPESNRWNGERPTLVDRAAGKVKSDESELWLRLVKTPKLIDLVRREWGFRGVLVKFKLEADTDDERLLEIAERSRQQSEADLMVANRLEATRDWAYIGPQNGEYVRVPRAELAVKLVNAVERVVAERRHG